MPDLIAQSPQEFVDLALAVRSDPVWGTDVSDRICGASRILYENRSSVREWEAFLSASVAGTTGQLFPELPAGRAFQK